MQSGRDTGFLQFFEQSVIKLFIGIGIPLQDVVLNHLLAHLIRRVFLQIERCRNHFFPAHGGPVVLIEALHYVLLLAGDELIHALNLLLQALDFREVRAVLAQCFVQLLMQVRLLPNQILDELVIAHRRHRIDISSGGQAIIGLFPHPVCLCIGEFLIQVTELLACDVLFFIDFPNVIGAFVGEPGVFRFFNSNPIIVQLLFQPLRGLRRRFIAAAEIVVNEGLQMCVQHPRRQIRVRG